MTQRLALASVTVLLLLTGCASTSHTTAWEYRWITPLRPNFQKELNLAAREGWELVSASPVVGYFENLLRKYVLSASGLNCQRVRRRQFAMVC
jgi:hypothetical protein